MSNHIPNRRAPLIGLPYNRRQFLGSIMALAGGCAFCLQANRLQAAFPFAKGLVIVRRDCPTSKVRLAKLYLGLPNAARPYSPLALPEARQRCERGLARQAHALTGVDFVLDELITAREQIPSLLERLPPVDGIWAIPLTAGVTDLARALAASQRPLQLLLPPEVDDPRAEWEELLRAPGGALVAQYRLKDFTGLAGAARPFRAIHRLREATIGNINLRPVSPEYQRDIADKFGTQLKTIGYAQLRAAYEAVDSALAAVAAQRWIPAAGKMKALPREEMGNSARMALAFERVLDTEHVTVVAAGCLGSPYPQASAPLCAGSVRLRSTALGGHGESYLTSALMDLLWQELSGRPVYISDGMVDSSTGQVVLIYCPEAIPTPRPDPTGPSYRMPTLAEPRSGPGPRVGQLVTQAVLLDPQQVVCFTGEVTAITAVPHSCRAQMTLHVQGSLEQLGQNGMPGLHGVMGYGDLTRELKQFCRFKGLRLVKAA